VPVAVSVPIRIRLDADAAYDQLDELDDAFDAATGRALGHAVHVANEAR
jgi:hypothetical protein